ncbi:YjcQ family protein [Paenibacillus sp. FSL P2-0322]|uniref:YjcQ family protein n=1 Tax=Paenibacillus sp. FSL P2-0322 TaxID=2921628 RepID=UPI0030CB2790
MNRKKVIYSILKEVQEGNDPKADDYGLSQNEFADIAQIIKDEGLLTNVAIAGGRIVWLNASKITLRGIEYLEDNSPLSKAYKGLKEVRDWLKL